MEKLEIIDALHDSCRKAELIVKSVRGRLASMPLTQNLVVDSTIEDVNLLIEMVAGQLVDVGNLIKELDGSDEDDEDPQDKTPMESL